MVRVIDMNELPSGRISRTFEGERHGAAGLSFFVVECPPGSGAGLHEHPYEEVFVVQEGVATFTAGEETVEVSAGQILVVPAGVPHKFVNSGSGPLRQIDLHPSGHILQTDLPEGE